MSEQFRLDRQIRFHNTFYTKCINAIIKSIGPSNILRSILFHKLFMTGDVRNNLLSITIRSVDVAEI